ncbi:MAG: hypothetical protein ABIQ15_02230 [Nocardioides sp.]
MKVQRLLTALAVPLVLLVSCTNDNPDPILAPTPSSTPTPTSAAPSPTKTGESETAEEFIERWVELSNEMQTSGDTEAYRLVSTNCLPCQDFASQIDDIYESGGFVETKGWRILSISEGNGPPNKPSFDVAIDARPTRYAPSDRAQESTLVGGRITERFDLRLAADGWSISNMSQVAS